jgi:MFS family permease
MASHLVIMNTWGFINSFGVFQPYYVAELKRSPSDVSWIGSLQVFLVFFIGTFTGRSTDAGLVRPTLVIGTVFVTLGCFTTSVATQYWQLILSQGLCMGLGCGFLFCPAISTVSTYFSQRRRHGRHGLPCHGTATPAERWVRVDRQGYWIRAAGIAHRGHHVSEDEAAA